MKRNKLYLTILMAIAAVGCSKEVLQPEEEQQITKPEKPEVELIDMTFTASSSDLGTKTTLGEHNVITWNANDAIGVFDDQYNNNEFTTKDGGATAEFKGKALPSNSFYAIYPYDPEVTFDGTTISGLKISATQKAVLNSFDNRTNLSFAVNAAPASNLVFKNIAAAVKLTLAGDALAQIASISLADNGKKALAGLFEIPDVKNVVLTNKAGKTTVVMNAPEGGFVAGTYVFNVAPDTFKDGVSLTFTGNNGKAYEKVGPAQEKALPAGGILNLGTIAINADAFEDKLVISDIVMPTTAVMGNATASIKGKGFQEGDQLVLSAAHYPTLPNLMTITVECKLTAEGIEFTVPATAYGINTVSLVRNGKTVELGELRIAVEPGTKIGGGVVYLLDEEKIHGYICNMSNIGTATEQFGPEVGPADAAGTEAGLGKGKQNTARIIGKMKSLMAVHGWKEWLNVKIAAELCDEHVAEVDGFQYDDWFLPSRDELENLWWSKKNGFLNEVNIPANNYWTSTEAEGNAGWAACYVNFYTMETLTSAFCSKSGWKIGVLPIRSF